MANQPTFRDFYAMAVRAALCTQSDGIVFDNESRDSFEKEWGELDDKTRKHWRDLAEILDEMNRCRIRLHATHSFDTTNTRKEIH